MNDKVKRLFNTNTEYITYWVSRMYEEASQVMQNAIVRDLKEVVRRDYPQLERANITGEDLEQYMREVDVDELRQLYDH